ncbi:MAG TPA: hypothetical protein PLG27_09825 [Candidatus Latescibacteria bacterium]|nr:hypothetical protein [Candidatus Latescibacterota bacterium]
MAAPETYAALVETLYQARLENRRIRIAHLRRMIEASIHAEERILRHARFRLGFGFASRQKSVISQIDRFREACRAEIARLRGEG